MPKTIEPGQHWLFTDSNDKRTEYVVVDPRDPAQMDEETRRCLAPGQGASWEDHSRLHSIVYLLNGKTGKFAMVTSYWLYGISAVKNGPRWDLVS